MHNILASASELLSVDPMIKEVIFAIIGLLVPALIGAVITYFSQPLIERRMAKIRVAEKIADKRLQTYEHLWSLVATVDKSKYIHSNAACEQFQKKFAFIDGMPSDDTLLLPAIFEDFSTYQQFVNQLGQSYMTDSILWDAETMRTVAQLNAYLTNVNFFFQFAQNEVFEAFNLDGRLEDKDKDTIFNFFMMNVGALCNKEVQALLLAIRKSIVRWYSKPTIALVKKDLDFENNTVSSVLKVKPCVVNKHGRQIIDAFLEMPNISAVDFNSEMPEE